MTLPVEGFELSNVLKKDSKIKFISLFYCYMPVLKKRMRSADILFLTQFVNKFFSLGLSCIRKTFVFTSFYKPTFL